MNLAIFDIDGTLVRPYRIEDASFLQGLEEGLGFRDVDPDWDKYPHVTDTGIVTALCLERWGREPLPEEMSRFRTRYHAAFTGRATHVDGAEIEGAADFVELLKSSADWHVAVATGNCHSFAILKLNRGRLPCLDVPMATADDAISRADLVRLALDRARGHYDVTEYGHVVSIGDAPWDLRTAREISMAFVAVGPRCGTGPGVIEDYRDQRAVLESLERAVCW